MKTSVTIPLTTAEQDLFADHETHIAAGLESFVDVGTRLLDIAEKRLYRMTHGSFEPYCKERWSMSARRAYQLCEASKVVTASPETVKNFSQLNESQAHELSKVEPAARVEVLEKAKATGKKLTAKVIKEVASAPTSLPAEDECNPLEIPGVTSGDDDADPWEKPHIEADPIEPKHCEPAVTEYYNRLEALVTDALENATVKQLNSMSVYAKIIPKLIKDAIASRQ